MLDGFKEILSNLLTMNPYFRWTASECLEHPIFDEIRSEGIEPVNKNKLKIEVDQDDAFDHNKGISERFTSQDLFEMLITEVDFIH